MLAELALPGRPAAPRRRFALRAAWAALRHRAGLRAPDIESMAVERWMVAEGTPVEVRPAKFLPGQLDRIRGTAFGTPEAVLRDFRGGFESRQRPTIAYRLRDVLLANGALYAGPALRHLRARTAAFDFSVPDQAFDHAAMYESWSGNRWFGNWLLDDCLAYPLSAAAGLPVTTARSTGHMSDYERRLGMAPRRVETCRFDELTLFDDRHHNADRRKRATDLRRTLVGAEPARHPGVYLLRGTLGARRVLRDEQAIAQRLAARRGFKVIDPSLSTLDEIIDACAGALVVAGVEGSHLVHGLMLMPPEARFLTIQPPARAVSVLKLTTDRQNQDYCLVVGRGSNESFSIDADDIERTLDLA